MTSPSFSQVTSKVIVNGSGFEVSLANKNFNYQDKSKNQFTIRDYYEFTDESSSGKFKLPSRNLIGTSAPRMPSFFL